MRGNPNSDYLQPPRVESANTAICINTSTLAVPDLPPDKVAIPPQEAVPADPPAPEPEPEPQPEPEPVIDPPPLEEPYTPMRDETGAIWLTCLGTPMMSLNENWTPENGVQRPRGFMYTLDFFRGERFNTRIVYSNSLDPRIDARGYLRNEPKEPINPPKPRGY